MKGKRVMMGSLCYYRLFFHKQQVKIVKPLHENKQQLSVFLTMGCFDAGTWATK